MPPPDPVPIDQTLAFRAPVGWPEQAKPAVAAHFLLQPDGAGPAKRIPLQRFPVAIGRTEPADLVLDGPTVSRRHCALALRQDQVILSDTQSTNGTFVNGQPVCEPVALRDGDTIEIGAHRLRYLRRDAGESAEAETMERELDEASRYVAAILPQPLDHGPVRVASVYHPCTRLAGDAFGYRMLDEQHFAVFLLDVAGHGTGSALHAVTVANVLRQGLLPGADMRDPASVLTSLNRMFPLEHYNGLFFTIWYGVYDTPARHLRFAAAGHHAAFLLPPPRRQPVALAAPNPAIGMIPGLTLTGAEADVPAGSALFLFSDGVFEIVDQAGRQWGLADVLPLLSAADGPAALYDRIRAASRPGPLEDDFSALMLRFP